MAFDFYDTNNDNRISGHDLFKILQTYNGSSLYEYLQEDILTMLKLMACTREKPMKVKNFRDQIQEDKTFFVAKQKVL